MEVNNIKPSKAEAHLVNAELNISVLLSVV